LSQQGDASVDQFLNGLDDQRDEHARGTERRRRIAATPQRWEYMTWRVYHVGHDDAGVVYVDGVHTSDQGSYYARLAEAGEEGWELINASHEDGDIAALIFKRPKAEG
jgi:hypothetical protein